MTIPYGYTSPATHTLQSMTSSTTPHRPPQTFVDSTRPICVEAQEVSKTFRTSTGRITAVGSIDLSIQQGEIVALLGSNGAGKSTFLDLVLGLQTPDHGAVRVFGKTPREAVKDGKLGAVLQTGGLLPDLTVKHTIQMIASTFAHPLSIEEVFTAAQLHGIADRKVGKCSGGEQQRVRFAMALLGNPALLILDEPTAGMDTGARFDFWENMQTQAQSGRTIIFATHYLEEVEQFAQRMIIMSHGSIVADGPVEEITSKSPSRNLNDVFLHFTRGKKLEA